AQVSLNNIIAKESASLDAAARKAGNRRLEDAMDPANATRYFLSQAAQVAGNKLRSSNIADKVQGTSISANGYEKNRKNAIAELLKFDKKLNFTGFAEGG